jgi:DNA-binding SARP family transcriptional activator
VLCHGCLFRDDPYEDWTIPLRRELQEVYLDLLKRLGEYYSVVGDLGACMMVSRSALAIEPCVESAHRELMQCYARQGQRDLALRQHHECRATLRAELETTPGEGTLAVHADSPPRDVEAPSPAALNHLSLETMMLSAD